VRDVAEGFRREAADAGTGLVVSAPEPPPGLWDRAAMTHITEALVANALRHGAPPVRVEVRAAGGAVLLTVSDTGPGLSQADQDRLGLSFEQAVSRRPQPGFGLGLWAVGQLAQALGGTVEVSTGPGLGTAVTLTLPEHGKA
jgi:signal transduction histidine kinase